MFIKYNTYMQEPPTIVTYDLIETFIRTLDDASPNTRNAYWAGLKLAAEVKLKIAETILQDFAAAISKRKFAKATRQLYVTSLRRFLEWLDATDQLPVNFNRAKAEAKLKLARGGAHGGYKFRQPDPDLAKIITYYDTLERPDGDIQYLEWLRSKAIMHTLYASAGRVSEVATLTRAQVADGRVSEVFITGKGEKQRMLMLTTEAQTAIRAYCAARNDASPALFVSHRRGKNERQPLTRASIWNLVKAAAKALGLSATTSPHSFRHFRATQLLNEGMPLESVQAYLGHTSPETTRIVYAHTHTAVLRDQLNTYGLNPKEAICSKTGKSNLP